MVLKKIQSKTRFNRGRSLSQAKAHEFELQYKDWSYRNREDKTNLPPNILITGSQNVLTNTSGRVGARKGYTLDGASDTSISSILSSYDYEVSAGFVRNVRAGFLTSAGNDGKLQFRYDNNGSVTWYTVESGQNCTDYNFTRWWDATRVMSLMLYVNGKGNIREWSGGVGVIASSTSNTVTISGTNTIAQNGFYTTGVHSVWIAGQAFGYTAISGNTFTGVAPDPTSVATVGVITYQKPETNTNSSMSLALTSNWLIGQLNNNVYVGDLANNIVYISKNTDFKSYTFTSPTRLPGEGATLTLNSTPRAFWPQEDLMYISSGLSNWGYSKFTLSSDNTKEAVEYRELNTVPLQGTQSQALTTKIRNNILFLSNEPILTTWGRVEGINPVPQASDISAPIVNDMNDYDFTNGSIIWHKNFIYVAVPMESKVLVYNMTNPDNHYWEAPQILPISRFYVVDGELYGHSYTSSESYKLFDGYNDNGGFIESKAVFAYNSHGERDNTKSFKDFFIEGYITSNTTLHRDLNFDLDGCATTLTDAIEGTDSRIVCIGTDDNSLGKFPLGNQPLGGNLNQITNATLPPKFRVIRTNVRVPYFEYSPTFRTNGIDQQWELLCFGPAWMNTSENQAEITE